MVQHHIIHIESIKHKQLHFTVNTILQYAFLEVNMWEVTWEGDGKSSALIRCPICVILDQYRKYSMRQYHMRYDGQLQFCRDSLKGPQVDHAKVIRDHDIKHTVGVRTHHRPISCTPWPRQNEKRLLHSNGDVVFFRLCFDEARTCLERGTASKRVDHPVLL